MNPVLTPERIHTLYRYFDEQDRLLYVGRTGARRSRGSEHSRVAAWWTHAASATFFHGTPNDVALAERLAIWTERPLCNSIDRVSTAARQEMLAALTMLPDPIELGEAARVLRLTPLEVRGAIALGFLESDSPWALRFTHQRLAAFIGDADVETGIGLPPRIRERFR